MEYAHQTLVKGLHIGNLTSHLFHSFFRRKEHSLFFSYIFLIFFLQEILALNATTEWPLFSSSASALFGQQYSQ